MDSNHVNNNICEEDCSVNIQNFALNSQVSNQVQTVGFRLVTIGNMDEINRQYLPQQNQSSGSHYAVQDLCIGGIQDISINNSDSKNGNTLHNTVNIDDSKSVLTERDISHKMFTGDESSSSNKNIANPQFKTEADDSKEDLLKDPNGNFSNISKTVDIDRMETVESNDNKREENADEKKDDAGSLPNKVRKLDEDDANAIGDGVRNSGCKRSTGTAGDNDIMKSVSDETKGTEDEDLFDTDLDLGGSESDEPCECDACILDVEQDTVDQNRSKRKAAIRTSSWKKIRNIVHWSPFIQQFKRRKYPWIQLAGHQGNFQAGEPGAILKKYDKREYAAFKKLMKDVLRPYVPEYRGELSKDGERFVQQQDLLCEFDAPCVMDMKMGCRTYLEEELVKARENPTLRKDMYQKMVEVDPNAPTEEEHNQKAITKPRYMQWRDDMSSSSELGFRIEGIRKSDGAQVKNFKKTKDKKSVKECLKLFVEENPHVVSTYLRRLKAIRATQEISPFFKSHEIIGSSLLFVHDRGGQASIWMIDFGKTVPLPDNVSVSHRNKWVEGNHEDSYLYGMDSLIEIFDELNTEYSCSETNTSDKSQVLDAQSSSVIHPQHQIDSSTDISVHVETDQLTRLKDDGQSSTV